jgi:hypothetical protein
MAMSVLLCAGDAVRITRGPLADATGVVIGVTDDGRFIITIDGVRAGVQFVVAATVLELANPPPIEHPSLFTPIRSQKRHSSHRPGQLDA